VLVLGASIVSVAEGVTRSVKGVELGSAVGVLTLTAVAVLGGAVA